MKPSDLFGVVVRSVGLLLVLWAMLVLLWAIVVWRLDLLIMGIPSLLVGMWLLLGASGLFSSPGVYAWARENS